MDIVRLKPAQWPLWRSRLHRFAQRYGDRRLTAAGLRAILLTAGKPESASSTPPALPLAAAIAHRSGKLLGFAFAVDAGNDACLVVVHPQARGQGVGLALIRSLMEQFGGLSCRVAADNTASLRLFFRAGLKAVSLEEGPTGKPTLLMQTDGFNSARRNRAIDSEASSLEAT